MIVHSSQSTCFNTAEVASVFGSSSRGIGMGILQEQLAAILVNEGSYRVLQVPCRATPVSSESRPLGEEWRRKICQWSFRVIDHFRLDREVVSFGLNIFDRFLVDSGVNEAEAKKWRGESSNGACSCPSCSQRIDSRTYQLAAMTSLYVAIKLHPDNTLVEGGFRKKRFFKLDSFVELSRGQFMAEDICSMEQVILETLKWKVNPPTPMALVAYLLSLMPPLADIPQASKATYDLVLHILQELSRYITELSVCLGSLCSALPASQVAYAAILVSMDLLTLKALPMRARDTFHAAVSIMSLQSGGTLLMPHKKKIQKLSQILSQSLLPEMLLEEYDKDHKNAADSSSMTTNGGSLQTVTTSTSCHPIVIARDFGLLNLSQIHRVCHQKVVTPIKGCSSSCHTSPTGVSNNCY